MIVKDSQGNDVEVTVYGTGDDIEIDSVEYLHTDAPVPDSEVDFIFDMYGPELEYQAIERAIMAAEAYEEGDR